MESSSIYDSTCSRGAAMTARQVSHGSVIVLMTATPRANKSPRGPDPRAVRSRQSISSSRAVSAVL